MSSNSEKSAGRLARGYLPHADNQRQEMQSLVFMFIRDLPLGIVPSRYSAKDSDFNIKLKHSDEALEEKLTVFLGMGRYRGDGLTESVGEFIKKCTSYMAYWGEMTFEILYKDSQRLEIDKLDSLQSQTIIHLPFRLIQVIPAEDVDESKKRFLVLPAKHFWRLTLPRQLGNPLKHRRMIRRLNKLSHSTPDFTFESLDMGGKAGFNYNAHVLNVDVAIERCTKHFGTIPSLGHLKHTTEYYYMVNNLQGAFARALIREHIISELNRLLARLNIDNELIMEGLPSSAAIRQVITSMYEGKYGFKEALDIAKP